MMKLVPGCLITWTLQGSSKGKPPCFYFILSLPTHLPIAHSLTPSLPHPLSPLLYRVELILDDQSEVVWCLPRGVDPLPLFLTSSFAIDKDEIGFIGGPDGKMFTFEV